MTQLDATSLEHFPDQHEFRLAAPLDGAVVRYSTPQPGVLDLFSTFVPPELRGQGAAHRLVVGVLQHVRENDLKVIPSCWYVARFIEGNSEYQDLVA